MAYDPLYDPGASNYLAQLARQPVPPSAPVAQAPKRQSVLDVIGSIGDFLSEAGGSPTLDQVRQDRVNRLQQQQLANQQTQGELDDTATKKMLVASQGLKAVYAKGGAPAMQAAWPRLAQMLNIPPEKAAQFNQMLTEDPEGTLQQMDAMMPPQAQGSKPKELQIYELLQQRDPARAEAYLQSLAEGGQLTPYQEEQIRLRERQIGVQENLGRERIGIQRERAGIMRDRAARVASGRAGGAAGPKPPAKVVTDYLGNQTALTQIDRAIAEVRKYPGAFGITNSVVPDIIKQRTDPKGVTARAAVGDIGSLRIHERTGATAAVREMQRLTPFIPSDSDTPAAILKKLEGLKKAYRDEQSAMTSMFPSLSSPTRSAPARNRPAPRRGGAPAVPAVGTVRQGYRFNGGDPANRNSWSKVN